MSELGRTAITHLDGHQSAALNAAQLLELSIRNSPDVALRIVGGEWEPFVGRPISVRDEPDGLIAEFELEHGLSLTVYVAEITGIRRPDDGASQS